MSETTEKKETVLPDLASQLAALKAENEALKAAATKPTPPVDDKDLRDKVIDLRRAQDKDAGYSKRIEDALTFNLKAPAFLKENASLLPAEVASIFEQANKEKYADAIEKDSTIKSNLIQSFFAVQANLDLLTGSQKAALDDFLKLTKTGKQDKAQSTYDMIFEPAFETLKRVKKAEALSKGFGQSDSTQDDYKNRIMKGSMKHYLGDKYGS